MKFVEGQFPVGEHGLKYLLVVLESRIATEKFQHLLQDVEHFLLDLIEHPLVQFAGGEDAGVLQVDQVAGSFGLCEFEDTFQVTDAHFTVAHDQVQDAEARGIGACKKDLGSEVDIKMF